MRPATVKKQNILILEMECTDKHTHTQVQRTTQQQHTVYTNSAVRHISLSHRRLRKKPKQTKNPDHLQRYR